MRLIHKILFFSLIGFLSCNLRVGKISEIQLITLNNEKVYLNDLDKFKATVITFLSPDCPVSENYTKTLNEIKSEYGTKFQVNFINIFPGNYYSVGKINSFINSYNIQQTSLCDKELLLVAHLNASITPETFVVNNKGAVVYSGAIDNWVVALGDKRQVITEFYLKDALQAIIHNEKIKINKTTAVGCFIEIEK